MALVSPHLKISREGNISVTKNNDVTISVNFEVDETTPLDLTDCIVYFTVRRSQNILDSQDSGAIIKKQYSNITDPQLGEIAIVLTRQDLAQWTGQYYYAIDLKTQDDEVITSFEGIFNITYKTANRTF